MSSPRVPGTDIKISQIALESERKGMSPDEICDAHPHLTLAQVHAALAHYHDNREAIRAEWAEDEAFVADFRASQ